MKKEEFVNNFCYLDDTDLEELARLIKGGITSGRIDGEKKHIYWELNVNVWTDL